MGTGGLREKERERKNWAERPKRRIAAMSSDARLSEVLERTAAASQVSRLFIRFRARNGGGGERVGREGSGAEGELIFLFN